MNSFLHIPMQISPTRQKLWRVLRFTSIVLGAWSIVSGTHRLFVGYSDIVSPQGATSIKLIRNNRTIANIRSITKGMNVVPGVPISLADALDKSSRSLSVWFNDDGSATMIIDRAVSDREALALESFGATVSRQKNLTTISNSLSIPTTETDLSRGIFNTLFTGGSGVIERNGSRSEISIEPSSVTIHGVSLLSPPDIDESVTSATLFSASIPHEELLILLPRAFTQNTPGFVSFFSLASLNGISANIHNATDSITYTLAIPLTSETQSLANENALTQLAKEIVEIPTIEGITSFLEDGSRSKILRSREEATVVIRNDAPYRFITATSSQKTVYITQTPKLLTVSNHIQQNDVATVRPLSCLSNATAFVQPQAFFMTLNTQTIYQPSNLSNMLWHVQEIASTSNTTRVCIPQ